MSFQIVNKYGRDPYLILIACLLSLRSRDSMTYPVVQQLFKRACTPEALLAIPVPELLALLKPLGMFRRKTEVLRLVSQQIQAKYAGRVPKTEKELLALPGVGRKTANLVLSVGFEKPAICVDVHVHRIANRMRWVHTKTPKQTELELQKLVPRAQWADINRLLVMWGQHHCRPPSSGACRPGCHFQGLCARVWGKP